MISSSKRRRISSPEKSESGTDSDAGTVSTVFTDDILPIILDNLQIFTPTDLLTLRLVNRCWRDAATSVLLKRNVCHIALQIGEVPLKISADVNPSSCAQFAPVWPCEDGKGHNPPIYKYYGDRPPFSLLPDLIQLISTSPKFPSKSIQFLEGCEKGLKNLSWSSASDNKDRESKKDELLQLFSLYGKNIQKLSISSRISSNTVQKLLFVHLPNLVCIDLRDCEKLSTRDQDQEVFHLSPPSSGSNFIVNETLKIETIKAGMEAYFHESKADFLEQLFNICPNLRAVTDVGVGALALLVKIKKAHFIKCLYFHPAVNQQLFNLLAEAFFKVQSSISSLKLSELKVELLCMTGRTALYGDVVTLLNLILRGSKDTLEYLQLSVNPQDFLVNIQIPPLGNLKCLKLIKETHTFGNPLQTQKGDCERAKRAREENIPVDRMVYDNHVFQFENDQNPNRIPPNYFPQLSKVVIDVGVGGSMNTYNKLLAFFALEHVGLDKQITIKGDVMPTVSALELSTFFPNDGKLGKLFPNVSKLKITCEPPAKLHSWVWGTFPKLERFEMFDFILGMSQEVVDSFFTGIPPEFCAKFASNFETAAGLKFSSEQIDFLRTQRYIGDCAILKEFSIHFKGKISSMFASKFTGCYGFRRIVDQAKITFSFETFQMNERERQDIAKYLEPLAPYITIRKLGTLVQRSSTQSLHSLISRKIPA